MPKALIITEKPSVARDIVAALGGFAAKNGNAYWESEDFLCTYAVGHIFTLFEPEDIDSALKQWKLSTLPILPKVFQLKPIPGHEARISVLQKLIERSDINVLINACDAAREGELIFREIVGYLGCRKWVRRLWLQSMTPEAIRHGFQVLRDGTDLLGLGDAAECRARSDWLIGMNATRAFSERLRNRGERTPWSVGRVQTPTLALLVERELQILGHRPRPFYRAVAQFKAKTHSYEGTWFDPKFKTNELHPERKDDRLFDRAAAEDMLRSLHGALALATENREESLRHAPPLFSLTGLQKYMAQRYKWSAKRTLESAQRCYETHKVLTYPRTSSSCLPEDYRGEVQRLLESYHAHPDFGKAADYLLQHGRKNDKRVFNNAGVTDHFAIIPTGKQRSLSGDDARLYDAVVRRFLATFHPPAVYDKVKRVTRVAGQSFRTGPIETLVIPGWLSVYDKSAEEQPAAALPPLLAGLKHAVDVPVQTQGAQIKDEMTKPPARINEAGLLGLMEHAGRQIEDSELQAALTSAEGLGTAATRADIIQNLKIKEYVDDTLRPTFKGIHLIRTLDRLQVSRLTSPELTAKLELELAEVESGKRAAAQYMVEINRYTAAIVEAARRLDWRLIYPNAGALGLCPICSEGLGTAPNKPMMVYERALFYACESVTGPDTGCDFKIWKDVSGRYMTSTNVGQLLDERKTHMLDGFKTRAGRDFKAVVELCGGRLRLVDDEGLSDFVVPRATTVEAMPGGRQAAAGTKKSKAGARGRAKGSRQSQSVAAQEPRPGADRPSLGPCPMHGPACQVIVTRGAFVCDTRLKAFAAGETQPKGVMIPRLLCKRELTPAEVSGMLATGATSELKGFISKSDKPFSATLVLNKEGGFSFEFADRLDGAAAGRQKSEAKNDLKGRHHKYPRRRDTSRRAPDSEKVDF